ncbi:hypothetical protein [Staphylococcus aureus]
MKNGFYATYRSKNKGKDKRSINRAVFLNSLLADNHHLQVCLLYTSPSPRDTERSRMPSSA